MSASDLSVFFRPTGVAVIGASQEQQKLGHGVVRNLQSVRYAGPVYPVNPHEDEILGYRVYPSIEEVPDPVDLAVIVVPAPMVAAQVEACGKRGIKGAIIVSGGFRETGAEGRPASARSSASRGEYGVRIIGPNCIGTIDAHTPLNTTFVVGMPTPGRHRLRFAVRCYGRCRHGLGGRLWSRLQPDRQPGQPGRRDECGDARADRGR